MMETREAERIGRTESLFREVNERLAEAANGDEEAFVCECPDPTCIHRIPVPLDEYEDVRSDPTRFVHAPGHGDDRVEQIVARRRRFHVVKKVETRVAATVRRLYTRAA